MNNIKDSIIRLRVLNEELLSIEKGRFYQPIINFMDKSQAIFNAATKTKKVANTKARKLRAYKFSSKAKKS